MKSKKFVSVRTAYYKNEKIKKTIKKNNKVFQKNENGSIEEKIHTNFIDKTYKSAISEFEHVLRTKKTNSVNIFNEHTEENITFSPSNCISPLDSYYKCLSKYKKETGRKCRKDMNTLFEHIVILSEEHVSNLESKYGRDKVKKEILRCLKTYSNNYSAKYGFTNCGGSLHLDEGYYDANGKFIRNIHAHIMFFNYDFKSRKSNLRNLYKKSINPDTKKTNELNKNFVDIQDMAYSSFKILGFKRGKSKLLTMKKHLSKHNFLLNLNKIEKERYRKILSEIKKKRNELSKYITRWFYKIIKNENSKIEASISAQIILEIEDEETKAITIESIKKIEKEISLKKKLADEESIIETIKKRKI